ncbi:MAG: calcium-binding protein [Pseudomonadota bacterium]
MELLVLLLLGLVGASFGGSSDDDQAEHEPSDSDGVEDTDDPLIGTDDVDALVGTSLADLIEGFGDDDSLRGQSGDDTILGGDGSDTVRGGAGDDSLEGGDGNDLMRGSDGDDIVNGGDGGDTMFGDAGDDTLLGGAGNDAIEGGSGDDDIDGDEGDDNLIGGGGTDAIIGGQGDDTLNGGSLTIVDPTSALLSVSGSSTGGATVTGLPDTDADTLIGGEGDRFIDNNAFVLDSSDIAIGGAGGDAFVSGVWVDPANPPVISDYDFMNDVLVAYYDETVPMRTVTITEDGDDALVELNGTVVMRVLDGAGVVTPMLVTAKAAAFA